MKPVFMYQDWPHKITIKPVLVVAKLLTSLRELSVLIPSHQRKYWISMVIIQYLSD